MEAVRFEEPVSFQATDETRITSLHDGVFSAGSEVLIDSGGESETAALRASQPDGIRIDVHAFLLERAEGVVLIDAGAGSGWGPAMGAAQRTLLARGGAAGIRRIVVTHPHGDHVLGLLDESGELAFPNAEVFVPALDIETMGGEETVRRVLDAVGDRVRPYRPGVLFDGIEAVALPGHTQGMCGVLIDGRVLIWADALHLAGLQPQRPEVGLTFDDDPALAVRTRRTMLAQAAAEGWLVGGTHLAHPGFARVLRRGDAFEMVAEALGAPGTV